MSGESTSEAAHELKSRSGPSVSEFVVDGNRALLYNVLRGTFTGYLGAWFRPKIVGRENVPLTGPVIMAPVHRSAIDFGFPALLTDRKLYFMAKDSLWDSEPVGHLLTYLGVFPVRRDVTDRGALMRAEQVLKKGETLVLFPEGTRQTGTQVGELLEGTAFLSARARAPIVPIGIANSERALPKGSKLPRPVSVKIVVGKVLDPPPLTGTGRISRSHLRETTELLRERLQAAYDQARA